MRDDAYDSVSAEVEAAWDDPGSPAFLAALGRLLQLAEAGNPEAAEYAAEILALRGPLHDAEAAYRWYYIALSWRGYSVTFADQNHTPPRYCGPCGDFRNEAPVAELVVELGFDRVRELDAEAAAWLRRTRKPRRRLDQRALLRRLPAALELVRDRVASALAPCVVLTPDAGGPAAARMGSRPRLPAGTDWPRSPERPMSFLGEIEFAALHELATAPRLPAQGRLLLFYDTWEAASGREASDRAFWRLVHVPEPGDWEPLAPPAEEVEEYPLLELHAEPGVSFCNPGDDAWDRKLAFAYWDALWDFNRLVTGRELGDDLRRHTVGGHPDWIQYDARRIAETQARGLTSPAEDVPSELDRAARDWVLLWQLSAVEGRGFLSSPYGTFYVLIRESDLERGDFSRCHLDRQFT